MAAGEVSVVLAVGASDSSGSHGLAFWQRAADACGVRLAPVAACVVARGTGEARGLFAVPPAFVARQMDAVAREMRPAACLVGMLYRHQTVDIVAGRLRRREIPGVVLCPAAGLEGRRRLLTSQGESRTVKALSPLASVIVCGAETASTLAGMRVDNPAEAVRAAEALKARSAAQVLLTGVPGLEGRVLWDGEAVQADLPLDGESAGARQQAEHLAAAVACRLAKGESVRQAVLGCMRGV